MKISARNTIKGKVVEVVEETEQLSHHLLQTTLSKNLVLKKAKKLML